MQFCTRHEGIIPALEPSHALAHVMRIAPKLPANQPDRHDLCGRSDKDLQTVMKHGHGDVNRSNETIAGRTA